MVRARRFALPCLVLVALALAGCQAAPGAPPLIDRYKQSLRMGVTMATAHLLTQNPTVARPLLEALVIIRDTLDGATFVSVAEVEAAIRSHVPWERIAPDMRPLVEGLLIGIGEEVRIQAQLHQIPQTQAILLAGEVLGWAQEVAQRHVVRPVQRVWRR